MLNACLWRSDSPFICNQRLRALMTSANHLSIFLITNSPSSTSMVNVRLPWRSASSTRCGCWRCILINLAQFLVTVVRPMLSGFEYAVLKGISICRSLSRQISLASCLLMLLKLWLKRMVMWNPSDSLVVGIMFSCI